MKRIRLLSFTAVVLLILAGCGYTTRSALPKNYRTVYVENFKNKINFTSNRTNNVYFPLLEVKITNAIINRFLFDGNLRVAKSAASADLDLSGALTGYDLIPVRYTGNQDVEEYKIQLIVNLTMKDARTGDVLWTENSFVGEGSYFVTGSLATSEASGVDSAVTDLAKRVVERTVENW